ncbi:MAG: Crp/Fnr family transcriptional regulator [Bacteriovoracaceae bacterium]|jgi:CRP-like cAMP-binding protein|nr:Crp/Fnr family transcriptional regulator [Bacteriovoracaceae bacterium]
MAQLTDELKEHFQSLTPSPINDWETIETYLVKKVVKKGEHFFQHFDSCSDLAVVSKGLFRIYLIDSEGEERTFSFISEKGFILDFFLSWEESSSMVSVQALEDSELYTINIDQFKQVMALSSSWSRIYKEVLLRNYMRKTKREIEFVLYNAKDRLKKCLKNPYLDMNRIPKTYLASYLGIAPPSLSRLLRDIKEEPKEESNE